MNALNPKRDPALKPLATLIALAAVATPATAEAKFRSAADVRADAAQPGYEREYRQVREKVVKRFSVKKAGRDLIRHGVEQKDGDVRPPRKGEVVESTDLMKGWLAPAGGAADAATGGVSSDVSAAAAGAPTSVIECESGGDYGAVNPAGYYGAYQFDQGTWDSYAPDGYAGTNPASAPPAVQDAAAAAVPYDAWPNC